MSHVCVTWLMTKKTVFVTKETCIHVSLVWHMTDCTFATWPSRIFVTKETCIRDKRDLLVSFAWHMTDCIFATCSCLLVMSRIYNQSCVTQMSHVTHTIMCHANETSLFCHEYRSLLSRIQVSTWPTNNYLFHLRDTWLIVLYIRDTTNKHKHSWFLIDTTLSLGSLLCVNRSLLSRIQVSFLCYIQESHACRRAHRYSSLFWHKMQVCVCVCVCVCVYVRESSQISWRNSCNIYIYIYMYLYIYIYIYICIYIRIPPCSRGSEYYLVMSRILMSIT